MSIVVGENIVVVAGFALALAALPQGPRTLRAALLLLALCGRGWAIDHHRWWPAGAAGALALANLVQLALTVPTARRVLLNDEEQALADTGFPNLPRGSVRQLLDQGLWIDGRTGEHLIREGEPASHLFYISEGEVSVQSGGREIATCGAGHFFGEITVLNREPAAASVSLRTDTRFWCIAAETLKRFIAANPDFNHALEAAFAGDLRDKLRLANRRMVALSDATWGRVK